MSIIKSKNLVANFANIVTANQCANIILAAGASPVMTLEKEDGIALVKMSASLVINIGTASLKDALLIKGMQNAALDKNIPIILDPVGSGATLFRTNLAKEIINRGVSLIRGNASEIMSLGFDKIVTKGVDNSLEKIEVNQFKKLAKQLNSVLVVSGEKDMVIDSENIKFFTGGDAKVQLLTGVGCMQSALLGALATENEYFQAGVKVCQIMKQMSQELFKNQLASYHQIYNYIYGYQ